MNTKQVLWFVVVPILLVVLGLSPRLVAVWKALNPNVTPNFIPPSKCTVVGRDVLHNSEDFAVVDAEHILITAGDLSHVFNDYAKAKPGALVLLNIKDQSYSTVRLKGFPKTLQFQPHGFFLANKTNHLFVVNHQGKTSQVEVFLFSRNKGFSLTFLTSIRSPFFGNMAINNVVEGAENELYITNWLAAPMPANGKNSPTNSFLDRLIFELRSLVSHFIPQTVIYQCKWSITEQAKCTLATTTPFFTANGITTNPSRSHVYVADSVGPSIHTLARDSSTGKLTVVQTLSLPYFPDNIDYDDTTQSIVIGCSFNLLAMARKMEGADVDVPGAMIRVPLRSDGLLSESRMERVLEHDGWLLSMPSVAVQIDSTVALGSPFSPGVLLCEL